MTSLFVVCVRGYVGAVTALLEGKADVATADKVHEGWDGDVWAAGPQLFLAVQNAENQAFSPCLKFNRREGEAAHNTVLTTGWPDTAASGLCSRSRGRCDCASGRQG